MSKKLSVVFKKSWKCNKKWSKKSLYKILIERQQWVWENHKYRKHEKIFNWKECINDQCRKYYLKKQEAWWKLQESKYHVKEEKYH